MHRSGDRSDRSRSNEGRKNSFSEDLSELYAGPTDFMEVGARGFLVSTLPKKEEFGVDDAIDLLRQTSIKLYGGYKPAGPNSKNLERKGYVKVICLDVDAIKVHPHPCPEDEEEMETGGAEASKDPAVEEEVTVKQEIKEEPPKETKDDKPEESEKEETKGKGNEETDGEKKDDESKEKSEEEQKEEEEKIKVKKEEEEEKQKVKKEEEEEKQKVKKQEEEEKQKDSTIPRMHSIYKFVAYRTEMRNILFIKSDVPDPVELAQAAMELVLQRNSVTGDAVCQLMPVLGVCHYDYHQLEIMCRRTLAPIFDEALEPKSFGVMLIDKLSEPGSEVVYETVRNTVWSVNPLAWMSSPISEPDVVLRFELIGTKLVLSCLKNYMSYRQYSPTLLVDMGKGEPEDDDGGWMSEEAKRQLAQKRLEKERQREQERQKELERQKERAKRQEEAEARRKAREEERKKREEERRERREKERKERDEKEKSSSKSRSSEKSEKNESSKKEKSSDDGSDVKETVEEGTPPSKKQRTDSKEEAAGEEDTVSKEDETLEGEELETSVTEETPPPKKQRVDSGMDEISKEDEELLLADDSKEDQEKEADAEQEETDDSSQKSTPKRATRGTRKNKARTSKK